MSLATIEPSTAAAKDSDSWAGPLLILWIVLTAAIQASFWVTGWRSRALAGAVEQGAAVIEARKFGEEPDAAIRRSLRSQRETLPFWTVMALMGDLVGEPASLALRALAVTTEFAALAALGGRSPRFGDTLAACAAAQGLWVPGSATRLGLALVTGNAEVDSSLAVALPPGTYRAPVWVALRQADAFAMAGWGVLAWCGWRHARLGLAAAVLTCAPLWAAEAAGRIAGTLMVESGMRLQLIPEWIAR